MKTGSKISDLYGPQTALVLGALLLSACGTTSTPSVPSGSASPAVSSPLALTRPDGSVRLDTDNEQIAALWASAERARSEGKPVIATELLYEALEVDPLNSLLWSRAAELQIDSVDPELAEQYAARSNELAGNNRPLLYRNWLIIEHARSMQGDLLGVRSAKKQVQLYQN